VEHDPEEIWQSQLATARDALKRGAIAAKDIAALGIANQRETTVLWHRDTGRPIGNAVVWQSRVSAGICDRLRTEGLDETFRQKTGLLIDPYFSGTKIKYLLDADEDLRTAAGRGEVLFGTVDSWLLWKLTGGRCHTTDYTNASRTLLLNLHTLDWDDELLEILGIPRAMLPEIGPSSGVIAETDPQWFGRKIPIAGIAGDQQAATFGQACFEPGSAKTTYGTGAFVLMNTGDERVFSQNRLLTTIGWAIGEEITWCLEGSIFVAGAVVSWLRDGLGIIGSSSEVGALAASVPDSDGVYFVPALTGLGAPHWDAYARGTILGISRGTTAAHIARAAVESMAFQVCDVLDAMQKDSGTELAEMKVDGGAAVNDALLQVQADLLDKVVARPEVAETTALGAAYLAGLAVGFWSDQNELAASWQLDREFRPEMEPSGRRARRKRWTAAIERARGWSSE
jgi:glycerol kinase